MPNATEALFDAPAAERHRKRWPWTGLRLPVLYAPVCPRGCGPLVVNETLVATLFLKPHPLAARRTTFTWCPTCLGSMDKVTVDVNPRKVTS
ncbi:MAG: hypothetical protein V4472_25015 [Pseudomonadota bacterium]